MGTAREALRDHVAAFLKDRGLKPVDLARHFGKSRQWATEFLKGKGTTMDMIEPMADFCGLTPQQIITPVVAPVAKSPFKSVPFTVSQQSTTGRDQSRHSRGKASAQKGDSEPDAIPRTIDPRREQRPLNPDTKAALTKVFALVTDLLYGSPDDPGVLQTGTAPKPGPGGRGRRRSDRRRNP